MDTVSCSVARQLPRTAVFPMSTLQSRRVRELTAYPFFESSPHLLLCKGFDQGGLTRIAL